MIAATSCHLLTDHFITGHLATDIQESDGVVRFTFLAGAMGFRVAYIHPSSTFPDHWYISIREESGAFIAKSEGVVSESEFVSTFDHLAGLKTHDDQVAAVIAEHPHLKPLKGSGWSDGRCAAHNIRIELKRAFPTVKFGVTSDHNAVNISWTDGPTEREIDAIAGRYKAGHFDGMTDCFEYVWNPFGKAFGCPSYMFTKRKASRDAYRAAYQAAGGNPEDVPADIERNGWGNTPWDVQRRISRAFSEHSFE